MFKKIRIAVLLSVLGALLFGLYLKGYTPAYLLSSLSTELVCGFGKHCRHIKDAAGLIPEEDVPRFEHYMKHILQESGVDLRFMFVKGTGDQTIESLATEVVQELRIGGGTGEQRGLLLLYDVEQQRLKIEVGYGLEGMFPDVFVNYLVDRHARMFFESRDISLGLRLLLRMLHHRVREAVLGEEFDPRVLDALDGGGHLSGGAGVSTSMASGAEAVAARRFSDAERGRYLAGITPVETYFTYLKWLAQPVRDGRVDFFTKESGNYMSHLPISPAYGDYALLAEYGKRYGVLERNNLAVLYFTNSPFNSPHFFVRENGKWRMDIIAEVRNTREIVGTIYTWLYIGEDDVYTNAFSDALVATGPHPYRRFRKGDNRPLGLAVK